MRSVSVYKRRDGLYIDTLCRATTGAWVGIGPLRKLSVGCSIEDLGKAVIEGLEQSKHGVPHPTDWDALLEPLLEAAKVKTYSAFCKGTRYCEVDFDGIRYTFLPTSNKRGTFDHLNDLKFSIPVGSSPAEVGIAVLRALELSS